MNGKKIPGWKQLIHQRTETRWIAASAMVLLCTALPFNMPLAHAQDSANHITDISVSPKGELIIEVDGEGFDPMLRLESAGNGEYRIVVQGEGVTLNPDVSQSAAHLGMDLRGRIPAIDKAAFTGLKSSGTGFQLVLTSWRKLQPQILINNGSQIVISLIGERSLPQTVSHQRQLKQQLQHQKEEQQRIAAQKKQEELKRQAEQLALQHQAELKHQAEIAASTQKEEQQRLAILKQQKIAQQVVGRQRESVDGGDSQQYANQQEPDYQANNNAESDDDFVALKWREAKRLAEQQRQALAHMGQSAPLELEAQAPQPKEIQKTTSAPTNNNKVANHNSNNSKGHPQSTKQTATAPKSGQTKSRMGNHKVATKTIAAKSITNTGSTATATTPASKPAEWQNAYVADKPMSASDFMAELQVAQQTGKVGYAKSLAEEISPNGKLSTSTSAPAPSTNPPQPANPNGQSQAQPEHQIIPVNFSGPTGTPWDDNTPTDPLRLKKLPPNFAPEPDPDAPPAETPMNLQQAPGNGTPGQSPGANARPLDTIYAVINQSNADPSLKQAWQALMAGDSPGAQAILKQHLNVAPKDVNARYLLAEILMSPLSENASANSSLAAQELANRRKEAQRQLLTNYAQSLHWPSCQALLEMFLDEGKLQEANGLLQQVKKAYPKEAGIPYEEGRLQEAMNNLDAARKAYQAALNVQSTNPEIHYRLAQVELKAGHLDAARWELLQALTWSPNDSRIYKLLGYIADRTGQGQQAAQAYRQALPVDALINYARTLESQHQPDRALSLYQAAEALAGDNGDVLYNLAMIYTNTHRPARATAVLQRFLSLNGASQDARTAKAKAMLQQLDQQK